MSRRVVCFLGKGGVGKTTCALALARHIARAGPVSLVSLDPAHSLGDLAGISLGSAARKLEAGLTAWEPDLAELARRRSDGAVERMRASYKYIDALNLGGIANLIRHAPGLEEQAALDALSEVIEGVAEEGNIVVDMPPTGLAVRTLALPALSLAWIRRLTELRTRILDRRTSIAHVRGELTVEGPDPRREPGADPVMDVLHRDRRGLERLRDLVVRETLHVLVVQPEPLGLAEARRIRAGLADLGTDAGLLVVNRTDGGPGENLAGLGDLPTVRLANLGAEARDAEVLLSIGRTIAEAIS